MSSSCLSFPDAKFFTNVLRVYFGGWLFYVGLMKWVDGPGTFLGFISSSFEKTWAPSFLLTLTAWIILLGEPLLGLWLLTGKSLRLAWLAASALMFMLTFGQTMVQAPNVTDNWFYVVLTAGCAAFAGQIQEGNESTL